MADDDQPENRDLESAAGESAGREAPVRRTFPQDEVLTLQNEVEFMKREAGELRRHAQQLEWILSQAASDAAESADEVARLQSELALTQAKLDQAVQTTSTSLPEQTPRPLFRLRSLLARSGRSGDRDFDGLGVGIVFGLLGLSVGVIATPSFSVVWFVVPFALIYLSSFFIARLQDRSAAELPSNEVADLVAALRVSVEDAKKARTDGDSGLVDDWTEGLEVEVAPGTFAPVSRARRGA